MFAPNENGTYDQGRGYETGKKNISYHYLNMARLCIIFSIVVALFVLEWFTPALLSCRFGIFLILYTLRHRFR